MMESAIRWVCAALCMGLVLGACDESESDNCTWTGEDVDQACMDGCVISRVVCQETLAEWDPCFAIEAECMSSCGG